MLSFLILQNAYHFRRANALSSLQRCNFSDFHKDIFMRQASGISGKFWKIFMNNKWADWNHSNAIIIIIIIIIIIVIVDFKQVLNTCFWR